MNFTFCMLLQVRCCMQYNALSWENLCLAYANNKGASQFAQAHSLRSSFIVRWLIIIISSCSFLASSKLFSRAKWFDGQKLRFSHDEGHIIIVSQVPGCQYFPFLYPYDL